jgi:hypothetical protein
VETVEAVVDGREGGAWRGYCVCGIAAAEAERAFEEAVEMLVVLEGGGRNGLGGDGFRWPKEGMGLVLVPDGGGVGWVIVACAEDEPGGR